MGPFYCSNKKYFQTDINSVIHFQCPIPFSIKELSRLHVEKYLFLSEIFLEIVNIKKCIQLYLLFVITTTNKKIYQLTPMTLAFP